MFKSSKVEQKRQLINLLLSNLKLRGKTLEFELKKPFNVLVNLQNYENRSVWLPLVDTFRTFYFSGFTDLKEELETIKTNFILA